MIEIKNNNFQEKLKNLTNFKFINLQKEDDSELEKELLDKENIEKFLSIGHNYINSQAVFNNQDKLLILTGNNFDNLFSLIKIVTYLLYRIFLECRGFKNKVGDAKKDIYDKFDELKKKILNHRTEFTKKPSINIVVNMEDYKSSIKPKKNDIDNNDLIITGLDIKKDEKLSLINSSDFIDNNIINEEDNSKIIDIDKNINDINKPQNIVKSIKDNNNNETITLFIGTFNVNALESELIKLTNLDPFLFPEKLKNYFTQSNYPTFYAIGLEEIMELKTKNILLNPKNDQVKTWEEKISQVLQEKFNYFLYHKAQLVGILFLFFVKGSKIYNMYNKHGKILKTGNMNLGNKGCCFLDFKYGGTSYGFCSGHLPAGQNEKDYNNRKEVLKKILDFKVSVNDFKNNDFFFIFGDLNFRISTKIGLANLQNHIKILLADSPPENKKMIKMNSENIFSSINSERRSNSCEKDKKRNKSNDKAKDDFDYNAVKKNAIDENIVLKYYFKEFLKVEELEMFKEEELSAYGVDESEISFPPTYKYVKETNFYNVSKRIPSWTDRILFKKGGNIRPILYDRVYINLSDHKPVIGLFEIDIPK